MATVGPDSFSGTSAIPGFAVIGMSVPATPPGDTSGIWFEQASVETKWDTITPKVSFVVYVGANKNAS